jgi:membrane-bound lytic murein transglycosylase D
VRLSDIRYWNNIRHNTIRSGQKLAIYVPRNKVEKYQDINELSFAEKQARIGKSATPQAAPKPVQNQSGNVNYVMYTVKQGDTLWDILKRYPGVTENDILKLNNLTDGNKLKAGQQIKIRPKS